jgi:hypothetical protein
MDTPLPVNLFGNTAMAGRSVQQSAAYEALTVGGKRVLHVVEDEVGRAITLVVISRHMPCRGRR